MFNMKNKPSNPFMTCTPQTSRAKAAGSPPEMPPMMDWFVLKALQEATIGVLQRMCGASATLRGIQGQQITQKPPVPLDISVQDSGGELSICLSAKLAQQLIGGMTGQRKKRLMANEHSDGVSELINMIAGAFRTTLSKAGNDCYRLSLPSDLSPTPNTNQKSPIGNAIVLFFEAEGESFSIQIKP